MSQPRVSRYTSNNQIASAQNSSEGQTAPPGWRGCRRSLRGAPGGGQRCAQRPRRPPAAAAHLLSWWLSRGNCPAALQRCRRALWGSRPAAPAGAGGHSRRRTKQRRSSRMAARPAPAPPARRNIHCVIRSTDTPQLPAQRSSYLGPKDLLPAAAWDLAADNHLQALAGAAALGQYPRRKLRAHATLLVAGHCSLYTTRGSRKPLRTEALRKLLLRRAHQLRQGQLHGACREAGLSGGQGGCEHVL